MGWQHIPMLKALWPAIFGIVVARFWSLPAPVFLPLAWALLLLLFLIHFYGNLRSKRLWFTFTLSVLCAVIGLGLAGSAHEPGSATACRHPGEEQEAGAGVVETVRSGRGDWVRLRLREFSIRNESGYWQYCGQELEAFVADGEAARRVLPGDRLLFLPAPRPVRPTGNPHAFDYAAYLSRQGIQRQVFLRAGDWVALPGKKGHWRRQVAEFRRQIDQWLKRYLDSREAIGLANALLVGRKEYLSGELRDQYAKAGTAHVLAVSGLHVGILAMGLGFLLNHLPLPRPVKGPAILLLSLLLLLAFCLLTGMAPSVLRASLMYGLMLISRYSSRGGNFYNSLAVAAWLLLVFDPGLLFDLGFQLSFLAVFGIVFFHPYFEALCPFTFSPLRSCWSLLCVSLAAQLMTFPLILYQFHAFPVYFWASGMIVVPLIQWVLYLGLLFLLTAATGWKPEWTGAVFELLLEGTNRVVGYFAALPGASLEGIRVDEWDLAFLYAILLGGMIWLVSRRHTVLWTAVLFGLVFCTKQAFTLQAHSTSCRLTVYQVSKAGLLVDLFAGRTRFTLQSKALTDQAEARAAAAHRIRRNIGGGHTFQPGDSADFRGFRLQEGQVFFYGQRIALIDQVKPILPDQPVVVDLLILYGKAPKDFRLLQQQYQPHRVILAGASRWEESRWRTQLRALNWPVHSLRAHGAFLLDWKPKTP